MLLRVCQLLGCLLEMHHHSHKLFSRLIIQSTIFKAAYSLHAHTHKQKQNNWLCSEPVLGSLQNFCWDRKLYTHTHAHKLHYFHWVDKGDKSLYKVVSVQNANSQMLLCETLYTYQQFCGNIVFMVLIISLRHVSTRIWRCPTGNWGTRWLLMKLQNEAHLCFQAIMPVFSLSSMICYW